MITGIKSRYKEYLKIREGVEEYNLFKKILYSEKDSLVKTLCENFLSKLRLPQSISVCDIGGGDGKRIVGISKYLVEQQGKEIKLDFVEQSKLMCNDFQQKLKTIPYLSKVNILCKEIEKTKLTNNYDLVFFIHSIFCLPDFEVFKRVLEKTKQGGIIIVVSNSQDSWLAKLKEELDIDYEDKRYETSDLIRDLNFNKIPFKKATFETKWILNEPDVEDNLAVILEWLSLGEYQWFDYFEKRQLIEFAKAMATKYLDHYLFMEQEEVLIIRKELQFPIYPRREDILDI